MLSTAIFIAGVLTSTIAIALTIDADIEVRILRKKIKRDLARIRNLKG